MAAVDTPPWLHLVIPSDLLLHWFSAFLSRIDRLIQAQTEAVLFHGKTLVVFGPCQVGKTVLLQAITGGLPEKSAFVSQIRKLGAYRSPRAASTLRRRLPGTAIMVPCRTPSGNDSSGVMSRKVLRSGEAIAP